MTSALEPGETFDVWSDLVGQDRAVETLQRAVIDPTAMTHAWLITGPPGSGRSNAAQAFAAALQCEEGGCGHCHECRSVLAGTHPDVTTLRTDKVTIYIDDVRELVQVAGRTTVSGRWRIIIVEDADRMLERTTNVLLKAIEEPPAHTVWILCAPSVMDVLITIRSRCRAVSLQVPDPQAVAELLIRRDQADPTRAIEAAYAAQSHVGRARWLATDATAAIRRTEMLGAVLGINSVVDAMRVAGELVETAKTETDNLAADFEAKERAELLTSLGAQDLTTFPPAIRSQIKQLEEDQKRRRRRRQLDVIDQLLTDLAGLYRDVMTRQIGAEVALVNQGLEDEIALCAQQTTATVTLGILERIAQARQRVAANVTPQLALEALLVGIAEPGGVDNVVGA